MKGLSEMSTLSIILLAFIGGSAVTGGTIYGIQKANKEEQDIAQIVSSLETEFEKAQASAIVNVTQPDLLIDSCSAEYIQEHGDLLCQINFCRMTRQTGVETPQSDCSNLSDASINLLKINTCFEFWEEGAGADQNSKFSQCLIQFSRKN